MSAVTAEEVMARLDSLGLPRENMLLLSGDAGQEGLIAFWHPEFGARFLIIENDALAGACYAYLLNRGARRFASGGELVQAAAAEKWPGWDTCEPSLRALQTSDPT